MSGPIRLEDLGGSADGRRRSPSAARNHGEILPVLRQFAPPRGTLLELASGTGEHAVHFARALPGLQWQPSERDPEALASIRAWRARARLSNLQAPVALDIEQRPWPIAHADAVLAINTVHISPWSTTLALLAGAARVLAPGAPLLLYGAFLQRDRPAAPSNLAFDRELRRRDPGYGVRQLADLVRAASRVGLTAVEVIEMPHNNLSVVLSGSGVRSGIPPETRRSGPESDR